MIKDRSILIYFSHVIKTTVYPISNTAAGMSIQTLKETYPMGLATTAMDLDDFEHLYQYRKNGIELLEATPIVTDNKSWQVGDPESTQSFISLCRKNHVKSHSIHSFYMPELGHDITAPNPETREKAIELNLGMFDAAVDIGADYIVFHLYDETVRRIEGEMQFYAREALKKLIPAAERTGIRIAVENLAPDWTITQINRLLDEFNHPLVGICLDTGHAALYSTAHEELELCGDRLIGFHIHDNHLADDDHMIPFRGKMDWEAFCNALIKNGYKGPLMYEAFNRKEGETVDEFIDACHESYLKILGILNTVQP